MTDAASLFTALAWACTAPVAMPTDPVMTPLPPLTLFLYAGHKGVFEATGNSYENGATEPVTWSGTWIAYDEGLALVGPWSDADGTRVMQAHSSHLDEDELLLDLRQGTSGLTLSCREDRRSL